MAINSIQLPDNTTQDIHDARLSSISELSIDSTPTANSNNLVKSGGVKAYVDGAIPNVPVQDVTVGGTSVVSGGTAAIPSLIQYSTDRVTDANNYTTNGYALTSASIPTANLPSECTSTDRWGVLFWIEENSTYHAGTQIYYPIDGTYKGRIFYRAGNTSSGWSSWNLVPLASDIPTVPTVPTISTNIDNDKTDNTKTASPAAVYNEVHPAIITTWPNNNSFNPNVVYQISGDVTGSKSVSLPLADLDETIPNHWYIEFNTDSTAPTINWASSIVWNGGSAPTINASKHYEISILYDTDTEFSKAVYIETEKTASS